MLAELCQWTWDGTRASKQQAAARAGTACRLSGILILQCLTAPPLQQRAWPPSEVAPASNFSPVPRGPIFSRAARNDQRIRCNTAES